MTKIAITELEMTCGACPSQWEGRTADGQFVYIRYRHHCLTAGVGPTLDEAVENGFDNEYDPLIDDPSGGEMFTEEMCAALADVFDFSRATR